MTGETPALRAPTASIVVCTRNRKDLLATSLESCLAQSHRPLEVIVMDDASDDGTEAMVRRQFPEVRFLRSEVQVGLIVLRNRAFREAEGEYVFSIDDDAYYTDPDTVGRVVAMFAGDARLAAVAMAFVETRGAGARTSQADAPADGSAVRGFRGCAHALRRESALAVGGYRDFFVHQGEERDLAIRLMDASFRLAYAATPPVVHVVSPVRDRARMDFYGVRNTLLFDWLNAPQPHVLPRLATDALRLFLYKLRISGALSRAQHVVRGLAACIEYRALRRPVSRPTYALYRGLPGHGPLAEPPTVPGPLTRARA